ncbi:hypothetical protein PPL19_12423 [Pseudomonas psychrotolerans L19]|uniref:PFL_4703 family integrating conjugative element protein n=1 Tax=Pseudomonas oryzihabitans TaxID=47885 RepID=UPI00023A47DC|nr:TIGR03746 family integrating conjugative element protein [Pseudomonas psychrotolerans]EHK70802.1 hypothetical protein PPL19_12423 [Pseudomonas psychrotolerans L19]
MSRAWKLSDSQRAHITTLRLALGLMTGIAMWNGYGWSTAPKDLTVHVPPDLRSGSTRPWWEIPPESVYAYAFYIFQQMNSWPSDGEKNYSDNIARLANFITPSCKVYLEGDESLKRNAGELRRRVRNVAEIPGSGYGDDPSRRVQVLGNSEWTVMLDVVANEYLGGEKVKTALTRYPLHVVKADVDPEKNPWGMKWDCYSGQPQRIEAGVEVKARGTP